MTFSCNCRTLFTGSWSNPETSRYCLPEVSADMMELIIQFAYTGHIEITVSNVERVLTAAGYLDIQGLLHLCCDFFKSILCSLNCISIWRTAEEHLWRELRDCAHAFILRHFEEISSPPTQEFLEMSLSELRSILEQDRLNVREEETVFKAVMTWIEHDLEGRSAHIITLLPKVRLGLTSIEFCLHKLKENQLICRYMECLSIIDHSLEILNKTSGQGSTGSPDPASRHRVPQSVLLAVGGITDRRLRHEIQAYDSRANSWRIISFPENPPQLRHKTTFLDGFIYIIGGYAKRLYNRLTKLVHKLNLVTKTWHQVASLNSYRSECSLAVLDGYIYAMGGENDLNNHNSVERYSPLTNQWTYVAPMHERRSEASATTLHGKIYICGGIHNEIFNTVECFDPQSDQWTFIAPMRRQRSGLGVITLNNKIYVVGGRNGMEDLRSVEVYDPQSNTWKNCSPMSCARFKFGIAVMDERLYVVGGSDANVETSKTEYYDEKTDTWFDVQDMNYECAGLDCCVISKLPNITDYMAEQEPNTP